MNLKKTLKLATFVAVCLFTNALFAQNHTVGLLSIDKSKVYNGYNLLYPHEQPSVFLLNNCGEIVHEWTDNPDSRPGNTAYLMEDGTLFKTKRSAKVIGNPIWSGGGGGTVEKRDWDNNLLWTFTLNDSFNRLHHDIEVLPNGNVLMICWEKKSVQQAVDQGRNPAYLKNNEVWSDKIIEVEPIGKDSFNILWEWHLWDHLVQDFDSTKPNYGKPEDFPNRVNINFSAANSAKNWAFLNAISYNIGLDQIVVSSPSFDEIWIIDHTTSTAQAKSKSGGLGQKGGDLLYRWGNPLAYNKGTTADQKLFFPHDIHWMGKNIGEKDFGKLMVYNNRVGSNYSTVNIFEPSFDQYFWLYPKKDEVYLPTNFSWTYKRPDSTSMYSSGLSSVQRLSNGNTLICAAQMGYSFEITPSEEIVWEYVTPLKAGQRVPQGDTLQTADNNTFRILRYALDFPAFEGKNLSPKGFIELNPDTAFCKLTSGIYAISKPANLIAFPVPTDKYLNFDFENNTFDINKIAIYSISGKKVYEEKFDFKPSSIDVSNIPDGMYFLTINEQNNFQKLIIKHE